MKNKTLYIVAFVLMALAQLYVPYYMIVHAENVLKSGKAFKFKTKPVDPSDPLRGKYIVLSYAIDAFPMDSSLVFNPDQTVYVSLSTDSLGFAQIVEVQPVEPEYTDDYVPATVSSMYNGTVYLRYDFDRLYLEESLAPIAEEKFRQANSNSQSNTYALIYVYRGRAVVDDVFIDGKSVKQ